MICPICTNSLVYESSCNSEDINLDIIGDITVYTCPICNKLFNLIHNHDTDEVNLEQY